MEIFLVERYWVNIGYRFPTRTKFRDPDSFNIERWLDSNKKDAFENLPFGAGARNCVG